LRSTALLRIPVGIVVERRTARNPWTEFVWRPASVLAELPAVPAGNLIGTEGDTALFYAGEAVIELHRTETANYRANLASGAPKVWVVLRPAASRPGYDLAAVTADPAEGEALTDAGGDLVETVAMPAGIAATIDQFIARHHVEQPFVKRHRTRPPRASGPCGDEPEKLQ